MVTTLLLCNRRRGCLLARLPKDNLYHILHFCRFDWAPQVQAQGNATLVDSFRNSLRALNPFGAALECEDTDAATAAATAKKNEQRNAKRSSRSHAHQRLRDDDNDDDHDDDHDDADDRCSCFRWMR